MGNVLEIHNLWVEYRTYEGVTHAVNGVDLSIAPGESLGLVGETGAGKTTTALAILRLLPVRTGKVIQGKILFEGEDLLKTSENVMHKIRGNKISMVFQNPLTSLNPVFTVGEQISVVLIQHKKLLRNEIQNKLNRILEEVGISPVRKNDYPNQFSGGMRQRVGIAAALACNPTLLIADEPTTALDVTIQAQVLDLMRILQTKYGTSLILITHNLSVVAEMCQKVAVMYAGKILEYGSVIQVFKQPSHPYTIGLINSMPSLHYKEKRLKIIPGSVPDAFNLSKGCPFYSRCPIKIERCKLEAPKIKQINNEHYVSCFQKK